jgi:hypothetical protein
MIETEVKAMRQETHVARKITQFERARKGVGTKPPHFGTRD